MSYYNTGRFIGCLLLIIICILFGAFSGFIFMLLWNNLAPLFWAAAPILSFWQAWGVCILLSWIGNFFKNKSK